MKTRHYQRKYASPDLKVPAKTQTSRWFLLLVNLRVISMRAWNLIDKFFFGETHNYYHFHRDDEPCQMDQLFNSYEKEQKEMVFPIWHLESPVAKVSTRRPKTHTVRRMVLDNLSQAHGLPPVPEWEEVPLEPMIPKNRSTHSSSNSSTTEHQPGIPVETVGNDFVIGPAKPINKSKVH